MGGWDSRCPGSDVEGPIGPRRREGGFLPAIAAGQARLVAPMTAPAPTPIALPSSSTTRATCSTCPAPTADRRRRRRTHAAGSWIACWRRFELIPLLCAGVADRTRLGLGPAGQRRSDQAFPPTRPAAPPVLLDRRASESHGAGPLTRFPAAASPRVWYRCRPREHLRLPGPIIDSARAEPRWADALQLPHVLRPVQASAGHRDWWYDFTYGGVEQATLEQGGRRRAVESSAAIQLERRPGRQPSRASWPKRVGIPAIRYASWAVQPAA